MPGSTSSTVARVTWVDVAKGTSIVLVVLFHSTMVDATPPSEGPWWAANAVFATLRMPLFFLAAGLFAASALRGSWSALLQGRVLLLTYVYVLWLTLRRLYFGLLDGRVDLSWQDYVLPDSDMWFLYVLAIFFVVARSTRSARTVVVVTVAAAVSVLATSMRMELDLHRFDDMAVYYVFFLVGARWSTVIRRRARTWTVTHAVRAGSAFLVLTALVTAADLDAVPPFRSVVTAAALVAGLTFAVAVDRTWPGRVLAHLGGRSLPIYVMHMIFIRSIVRGCEAVGLDVQQHVAGPVVLTVLAVAASVGTYRLVDGVPGLFAPPAWLRRSLVRAVGSGARDVHHDVARPSGRSRTA